MHSDERRKAIADVLHAADAPISASALCTTDMKIPPLRPFIIAEKRFQQ